MGKNKREEKRKLAEKRIKKQTLKVKLALVLAILLVVVGAGTFGGVKIYLNSLIGQLPKWEKIGIGNYDVSLEDVNGMVTLDEYTKLRADESKVELEKARHLLGDEISDWYLDGINSEYYTHSCIVDYETAIKDLGSLQANATLYKQLLDEIKKTNTVDTFLGCHREKCAMKKFIESYTTGDLKTALLEAHANYETLIEYYSKNVEISDDDIQIAYQEQLVTNLDYLDSIEVEIKLIKPRVMSAGDGAVAYADKLNKLESRTLTIKDREALELIPLYNDKHYYDDTLSKSATGFMTQLFGASGLITNNDTVEDVTDVQNLDAWLEEKGEPKAEVNSILNDEYITYRLTGYDPYDMVGVVFNVKSVKHKELPALSELQESLEKEIRTTYAEADLYMQISGEGGSNVDNE